MEQDSQEQVPAPPTLAVVTRDGAVESSHRGWVAISTASGELVKALGDPTTAVWLRSAAKPAQTVVVLESGAGERFDLTDAEVAVMTASHSGEAEHLAVVQGLLERLGLSPDDLACGAVPPLDRRTARELERQGERPSTLHSACSGKHAGMLAACLAQGLPTDGYWRPEHPLQVRTVERLAELAGVERTAIRVGTDGCGVPTFTLPLAALARSFARFVAATDGPLARTRAAYGRQPKLAAGTGRPCTTLLEISGGRLWAKTGSEGLYCVGLPPAPAFGSEPLGLAVKIEDGSTRALPAVLAAIFDRLGVWTSEQRDQFLERHPTAIRTNQRVVVGEIAAGRGLSLRV
ncbi:MAG: asparaginase [Chloroflexi bacterium]|nr:asparaginase [Chloroflexota bacterium]